MYNNNFVKAISVVTLLAFIVTSCSPTNYSYRTVPERIEYSLTPRTNTTKWINGVSYAYQEIHT